MTITLRGSNEHVQAVNDGDEDPDFCPECMEAAANDRSYDESKDPRD